MVAESRSLTPFDSLTRRERDCLDAYALHGSVKDGARSLGIRPDTFEGHLRRVREKLRVEHTRAAVRLLHEAHRTPPGEPGGVFAGIAPPAEIAAPNPPVHDAAPLTLRDSAVDRDGMAEPGTGTLRRIVAEVLSGTRAQGLTMLERGALVVAALMVIGFVHFGLSAVAALTLGLARIVRAATH